MLKRIFRQWEIIYSVTLLSLFEYFSLIYVYLVLHPYTFVQPVCQGLLMAPRNTASKVRTLSTVRHPELIALYASAPNHVLGQ